MLLGCTPDVIVVYVPVPQASRLDRCTAQPARDATPAWLVRAIADANSSRPPRPPSISLGYAGDGPLTGGVMSDGSIPNEYPFSDDTYADDTYTGFDPE